MKYIDAFRDPRLAAALHQRILAAARRLPDIGRPIHVMEVCGTHTVAIARSGIRGLLPANVGLLSGPGCPVCVTEPGFIDAAIALAQQGHVVATFGDMMRVPGSVTTLADCRARGGAVEPCYSPLHALELARAAGSKEVVFLAVGFETTIAPVVGMLDRARAAGLENLSLLVAFKLVPPALAALRSAPDVAIDAFLCPAHVSAIIGADAYLPFSGPVGVPCVVAGFEPVDILMGLEAIILQRAAGESRVQNLYARVVRPQGNVQAQALIDRYTAPCDAWWRGLGRIPASGLRLRPEFAAFDAESRFGIPVEHGRVHPGCRCGDVLAGRIAPPQCPFFGRVCNPDHPLGPCMVSSEGTCAAYHKYAQHGV